MNNKTSRREKSFLSNLSVAFLANAVTLFGNVCITLLLPKFIGVTQYAYYQLYVFYASYVGFFSLGWTDGLYLRHGGAYYDQLDKPVIYGQLRAITLLELALSVGVCLLALGSSDADKATVLLLFGLCILIYLPRAFLHNLLQATNRVDQHALGMIIDKVVHLLGITLGILTGRMDSTWFILSDLIGRACGGCYIFYVCRDLFRVRVCSFQKVKSEAIQNISCGFILMVSNVASMLIIGIVRQGIEIFWDVETFGKLSLTLSISNMLMTFINSIAMVLFPILRRASAEERIPLYRKMRTMLIIPITGVMVLCYPVRSVLSAWLPQYAESLKYTAILFVMCIYESKMSMLINTYLKALRQERLLLRYNVISVAASLVLTLVTCGLFHNLDGAVFSIVLLLALRSTLAECALAKQMGISVKKEILTEHLTAAGFIAANWVIGGVWGMVLYGLIYGAFLAVNREQLKNLADSFCKR